MEKQTRHQQEKLRFMLPVLITPFLTLLFWALGGGSGSNVVAQAPVQKGLKTELPSANLKNDPANKMSYYDLANADSIATDELKKNDPYYRDVTMATGERMAAFGNITNGLSPYGGDGFNANAAAVYQKINEINSAVQQAPTQNQLGTAYIPYAAGGTTKADLDKLERMMQMMESTGKSQDPEMQEVNTMLERILDIQNPALVQEKLRAASRKRKGQVFSVTTEAQSEQVSLLKTDGSGYHKPTLQGFFSLEAGAAAEDFPTNTIKAVVHGTQTIVTGAELKMRLVTDAYINGIRIPKDLPITGIAELKGERLMVQINQLQYGNHLFPVNLSVYDLTGLEGIRIDGAMSTDIATQTGSNALQGLNLPLMEPSLATQAASAGIEFTKGLIGKKAKRIPVTVKAGHKVLLKDENQDTEGQ